MDLEISTTFHSFVWSLINSFIPCFFDLLLLPPFFSSVNIPDNVAEFIPNPTLFSHIFATSFILSPACLSIRLAHHILHNVFLSCINARTFQTHLQSQWLLFISYLVHIHTNFMYIIGFLFVQLLFPALTQTVGLILITCINSISSTVNRILQPKWTGPCEGVLWNGVRKVPIDMRCGFVIL
jgi:hypothetical protein